MQPYPNSNDVKAMHEEMIRTELKVRRAAAGWGSRRHLDGIRSLAARFLMGAGGWISPEPRSSGEPVAGVRAYRQSGSTQDHPLSVKDPGKAA